MNPSNCSFAKAAAAVLVAIVAVAVAPTVIDADVPHGVASGADATHSWLATAFPTGQATFARSAGRAR
jgi:hypothetical protein